MFARAEVLLGETLVGHIERVLAKLAESAAEVQVVVVQQDLHEAADSELGVAVERELREVVRPGG